MSRIIVIVWHFDVENCNPKNGSWEKVCKDASEELEIYRYNGKNCIEIEDIKLYLISHPDNSFNNTDSSCMQNFFRNLAENNDKLLLFLHNEPYNDGELNGLKKALSAFNSKITCKQFTGGGSILYEIDEGVLRSKCISLDEFSKHKEEIWKEHLNEKIKSVLLSFTPLHLSLQAFWGVAVKEVSEDLTQPIKFVKIGTRNGDEYLSEINTQREKLVPDDVSNEIKKEYREIFPNSDSFLLVKEAEYDFYAPLIDLVVNGEKGIADENKDENKPNCDEERDMYEMPTLKEVIEEVENRRYGDNNFFASLKSVLQNTNANSCKPTIKNGSWTYNSKEFISCLREICAILANTCEKCQKDGKYFGYKGKNKKQNRERKDKGINNILSSLGENFKETHCKLEEFEGRDKVLIKQLTDWSIEKALVVIAGIEVLGRELSNLLV